MSILHPAPKWNAPRNRYLTLFHGCTTVDRDQIKLHGIDPNQGRLNTDFGRGFYTTTLKRQAQHWAWTRFYDPKFAHTTAYQPVVLQFTVDRYELAKLDVLSFQLGDYGHKDFWSLVQHCRQSNAPTDPLPHTLYDHSGPHAENGGNWYDIVCGPVSAFWKQRSAMHDADQVSFHTTAAAQLLNRLISSNDATKYEWHIVT